MNCIHPHYSYDTGIKTKKGRIQYFVDLYDGSGFLDKKPYFPIDKKIVEMGYKDELPYVGYRDGQRSLIRAVQVPCGVCPGCLIDKKNELTTRLYLESLGHLYYYFTTLTFDDVHYNNTLDFRREHQLFMKRLRKSLDFPIRFYSTFEFGEHTGRGHFHDIIFFDHENYDRLDFRKQGTQFNFYDSKLINDAWSNGFTLTAKSYQPDECLRYVAGYCTKKLNDDRGFRLGSRNPGLGIEWLESRYGCLPSQIIVHTQGKSYPAKYPKIFKDKIQVNDIDFYDDLQARARRFICAQYDSVKDPCLDGISSQFEMDVARLKQVFLKHSKEFSGKL